MASQCNNEKWMDCHAFSLYLLGLEENTPLFFADNDTLVKAELICVQTEGGVCEKYKMRVTRYGRDDEVIKKFYEMLDEYFGKFKKWQELISKAKKGEADLSEVYDAYYELEKMRRLILMRHRDLSDYKYAIREIEW